MSRRGPRRILVVRPDRIGDVTLATPVIRALRVSFPDAYIAALVRPATEAVLRHNPRLDAVLVDDWEHAHAGRRGFLNRLRLLRGYRFDTALMLLPTERHAWMTFLAGIRTRYGVGTKLYQLLTFTRSVSRRKYVPLRHEADYCLDLARAVGARDDGLRTEAYLVDSEREAARSRLHAAGRRDGRPLVSVHPESGRSAPNWTAEMYRDFVARAITEIPEAQFAILLPPGSAQLRSHFEGFSAERVLIPEPADLRMLMGLIAEADVAVSASTGPMHLASALGTATVSLFCPLPACSPRLWGPQGNRAITLLPPPEYCQTRCPGDPHICTLEGGLGPDDVIAALRRLIIPPRPDA